MPGLPKGEVFLCSDRGHWPAAYEKERRKIMAAILPWAAAIHHIGSTAVPGLAAKPIIDMMPETLDGVMNGRNIAMDDISAFIFHPGGKLHYLEEPSGDRVTASYSGDHLTGLTHSSASSRRAPR